MASIAAPVPATAQTDSRVAEDGLSEAEAARRVVQYGWNDLVIILVMLFGPAGGLRL
jgi:Cation transporter/ATPase, N-terminus